MATRNSSSAHRGMQSPIPHRSPRALDFSRRTISCAGSKSTPALSILSPLRWSRRRSTSKSHVSTAIFWQPHLRDSLTPAISARPADYSVTLNYISSSSANGKDSNGNPISGFKWWNFTFPTVLDSGANAVPDFISATGGGVNFGGSVGAFDAWGESYAGWNDPANPTAWAFPLAVLMPQSAPLGVVAAGYSNGTFTMTVPGGVNAATTTLNTNRVRPPSCIRSIAPVMS